MRSRWRAEHEGNASLAGPALQVFPRRRVSACSAAYPAYPKALCGEMFDQALGMIALHFDRAFA